MGCAISFLPYVRLTIDVSVDDSLLQAQVPQERVRMRGGVLATDLQVAELRGINDQASRRIATEFLEHLGQGRAIEDQLMLGPGSGRGDVRPFHLLSMGRRNGHLLASAKNGFT